MGYQRSITKIDVVICESGLVLKISDIKRISVKRFTTEEQVLDKLKGEDTERLIWLETKNDGIQCVDLENKFNNEFNLVNGGYYDKGETMFKTIVESWLKLQER